MSLDLHRDPAWFRESIRHTAAVSGFCRGCRERPIWTRLDARSSCRYLKEKSGSFSYKARRAKSCEID
jgi:hypothetical protein